MSTGNASGHLHVAAESKAPYDDQTLESLRADALAIIARYPQPRSALLPMLHLVQSVDGRVSPRGIEVCADVLGELGLENDRLFKLAKELEKIALEDPYFVEKKLYPNVDFYSGIVQKALGIPTSMFTCIFALARTVGWITQWEEMITDPEYKIGRPRQLYIGTARRDVPALGQRP